LGADWLQAGTEFSFVDQALGVANGCHVRGRSFHWYSVELVEPVRWDVCPVSVAALPSWNVIAALVSAVNPVKLLSARHL
jgi:hypothetical protein